MINMVRRKIAIDYSTFVLQGKLFFQYDEKLFYIIHTKYVYCHSLCKII